MKKRKQDTNDARETALERLSRESGTIIKNRAGRVTVALVYPNLYEVGMCNLGFQKVYKLFNDRSDTVCERFFLPSDKERSGDNLLSIETGEPLSGFDIVAFSITFEDDYLNVLKILKLAHIPLRREQGERPLLCAGGVCPTLNPEPLSQFMDLLFIGEGEGIVDRFCDSFQSGAPHDLSLFGNTPGIYVPSAYEPVFTDKGTIERYNREDGYPEKVERMWERDYKPNVTIIRTPDTVFGDMSLVEIGKGCGRHCRFCVSGYIYRPTRYAPKAELFRAVDEALEQSGKVGLVGSAICDHPEAEALFRHIVDKGASFSVSSLRLEKVSRKMAKALVEGDCKTVTLAPEAGSYELRKIVNKDMRDETILNAVRVLSEEAPFKIKLYFLVGLPEEREEDVAAIAPLVKKIQQTMIESSRTRGTIGSIIIGLDGLVPKPGTPWQWRPFAGIKPIRAKLRSVKSALDKIPNVTVQVGSARNSYVQTVLSLGDRRVGEAIELALENGGDWFKAFREASFDPDFFALRKKSHDEILPWAMVGDGLYDGYLKKEDILSTQMRTTAECPTDQNCLRCGSFTGVCSA